MQKALTMQTPIILASASPRRKQLIDLAFSDVEILPSNADESKVVCESIEFLTEELAELKAMDIASKRKDKPVIGCDTVVIFDNKILGKPKTEDDAIRMLSELSGRTHTVSTGCCIIHNGRSLKFHVESKVRFFALSDELIRAYVSTGEPMDKAGSYGIQERGALLVEKIDGDYFNIVGLPIAALMRNFIKFENEK